MIALLLKPAYAHSVAKKDATGFSSLKMTVADDRQQAVFFRPHHRASYGAAVVGRLRPAGFHCHRSANPTICRSSPFSSGRAVHQPTMEAHMPGITSSAQSTPEQIRYLARAALAIANVLEAIDVLPDDGQEIAIAVSATLADDLARALAALNGGAA